MKARVLWSVATHPANRRFRVPAVFHSLVWQVRKRVTAAPYDAPIFFGMVVRCYPDSHAGHSVISYRHGLSDFHEMSFLKSYLKPGDAFLDIGANVGMYSLLGSALVGPTGHVDAFEPDATVAERLRENFTLNRRENVVVHQSAVGKSSGTVEFTTTTDDLTGHISYDAEVASVTPVPCVSLDEFAGDRTYAAGKIDVEGAEPLVLQGAEHLLAQANPPVWLLEMNGRLRGYGWTETALRDWLAERGYDLAVYDADTNRLEYPREPWLGRENIFCVARSCREQVESRLRPARA